MAWSAWGVPTVAVGSSRTEVGFAGELSSIGGRVGLGEQVALVICRILRARTGQCVGSGAARPSRGADGVDPGNGPGVSEDRGCGIGSCGSRGAGRRPAPSMTERTTPGVVRATRNLGSRPSPPGGRASRWVPAACRRRPRAHGRPVGRPHPHGFPRRGPVQGEVASRIEAAMQRELTNVVTRNLGASWTWYPAGAQATA